MGEELTLTLTIEWEREDDGRWIADIPELPGVMAYGASLPEAVAKVSGLGATRAIELLADRELVFAFHDSDEIGPKMLARIAKASGLTPRDL